MNYSKVSLRFLYFAVLIALVLGGCKNNPPVITHNQLSDTIEIDHGDVLDLEFRFSDDKKELKSARILHEDNEIYSGTDSLFLYTMKSADYQAGEYLYSIIAEDADEKVSDKKLKVIIRPVSPLLSDLDVKYVGATFIKASFRITGTGGVDIMERGIMFSEEQGDTSVENKIALDNNSLEFDGVINGLPRDKKLQIRVYATNIAGTGYSEYAEIKTRDGIPAIRTGNISNIHSRTVDASGSLISDGGEPLNAFGICYSEDPNPGIKDFVSYASGNADFRIELDKLVPFTKYYFRAFARNRFATSYGDIKEFETTGPPTVETGKHGRIMVSSVEFSINVTDNGGHNVTDAGICYSMMKNPTIDNNTFSFGKGTGLFEEVVVNLDPGSRYFFRAYAVNSEGVSYGDEIALFTKIGIPEVNTEGVADIDYSSVTVLGDVPDDGGLDVIERGIVWDSIPGPTREDNYSVIEGTDGKFECKIEGLKTGQKYYARAYARNERGIVYADAVDFVPLIKTDMILVDAGTFEMGFEEAEEHAKPVHEVKLDSFLIGRYEVTNGEFAEFLNYHIEEIEFEGDGDIIVLKGKPVYFLKVYGEEYSRTGFKVHIFYEDGLFRVSEECARFPAILVTWPGAQMYCEWAGGRLPTEAEWEYAARGGNNSSFIYSGGNDLDQLGWYYRNSRDAECQLMPNGRGLFHVGLKQANSLGIYDMSGNVNEWCLDIYDADYYETSPPENPAGPEKGLYRVLRGGSWADREENCTVYARIKSFDINRGYDNIGFRLVRPLRK